VPPHIVARVRSAAIALGSLVLVLAGCGGASAPDTPQGVAAAATPASGAPPWPAPSNAMALTRKAGLVPETHEFLQYHVHAHLDVLVNGKPVVVPAAVGIDIANPRVKHGVDAAGNDEYGGIDPPCTTPCISPLHTHDVSGVLHTESKSSKPNTLGQFFTEWNVPLDAKCVGGYCKPGTSVLVYVDGKEYTGDPREIELTDRKEIAIVIGTPPAEIPYRFPS
jgi:hypothetical protein